MKSSALAATILSMALAVAPRAARAEPSKSPAEPPSPAFERVKSLAGEWEGTGGSTPDGKPIQTRARIQVVSGGSAVMITTDPGGKHEMVTLIHRDDGGALLATHYCAAQNQPRMKAATPADPGRIAFEFIDGTNLAAYPGRMQRLVLLTPGPDRHVQEWTYRGEGKDSTDVFDMKRVK
jgi:hypothetical protein